MTSTGTWPDTSRSAQDAQGVRTEGHESGTRRRKLAGYFKAASELKQAYQQSYMQGWGNKDGATDSSDAMPGAFPGSMAVSGTGGEEMTLFPSYARRHVKQKPRAVPGTIQESGGSGRDVRDSTGTGDAEYWRQQWDMYEDDNAIVDVDVRGWIYTPHKGPLSRKNRIFIGLARQMVGIQAPTGKSPTTSGGNSRESSPHGFRERVQARVSRAEEEIVAKEAESLMRRGEEEAQAAGQGEYSERPRNDPDSSSIYSATDRPRGRREDSEDEPVPRNRRSHPLYMYDDPDITPVQKRASWNPPTQMSAAQLSVANGNLMTRLQPFLANPLANIPISAFFYNDENSRQRTFETDAYGHFNFRAALDFIPTHVRILASEGLSFTEKVHITEPKGVSVISDIDDTIKHSAIGSGVRETFRNVFIRDLGDLSIQGVQDWYQRLSEMGVGFHYVSNSPWQLYPILTGFFALAGLPDGSFHLKQYSGMFQGIFEPVAERKKGTLERIMHDFPERRFLLVGDSGEADLEVYTDVVLENPGRVLGVFIRDVTTPIGNGYFDSAMGPLSGDPAGPKPRRFRHDKEIKRIPAQTAPSQEIDDPELRAAIAASLKEFELHSKNGEYISDPDEKRPALPTRRQTEPLPEEEDLIDLNWEDEPSSVSKAVDDIATARSASTQEPPPRPSKPEKLSALAIEKTRPSSPSMKVPPPRPRKPSTSIVIKDGIGTDQLMSTTGTYSPVKPTKPPRPAVLTQRDSYRDAARPKISSAYNHLPSPTAYLRSQHPAQKSADMQTPTGTGGGVSDRPPTNKPSDTSPQAPPPLPARKPLSSYPAAAAQYASSLYASATSSNPTSNTTDGAATPSFQTAGGGMPNNPAVSKKEEMWKRRWARAKAILDEKGVVLRSWRVGGDVMDDVVGLVEKTQKHEADSRRGGVSQ